MQTKHLYVLLHIWTQGEVGAPWNRFKLSRKIFLLTVPRRYFFCGSFVWFMSCVCHAFASVHFCLVVTWRERADLLFVVFIVILLLSHLVSWDRCGTWLYRLLILAVFLNLPCSMKQPTAPSESRTSDLSFSSLTLYHCATAVRSLFPEITLLHSKILNIWPYGYSL